MGGRLVRKICKVVTNAFGIDVQRTHTYEHQLHDSRRGGYKELLYVLGLNVQGEAAGYEMSICDGFRDLARASCYS